MNDPNLAPYDCISNIEGTQSSSPLQGVGSHLRSLDPSNEVIKRGRVDDIYMDKYCAVVSLYGYRKGVPCFWASDSSNQLTGAKTIAPPSVGTEVGVILSMDQKYGYIIAMYPSASNGMPSPTLFATSVSRGSDNEVHIAKNFGFGSCLPAAAGGTPTDVLPGDHVIVNGAGAMLALLEFGSMIGAGGGASAEAFVVDQLARVTGWNEQTRNSLLERAVMEDWGNITEDEYGTHLIAETRSARSAGYDCPTFSKSEGASWWPYSEVDHAAKLSSIRHVQGGGSTRSRPHASGRNALGLLRRPQCCGRWIHEGTGHFCAQAHQVC
jgi:hypothetical protein